LTDLLTKKASKTKEQKQPDTKQKKNPSTPKDNATPKAQTQPRPKKGDDSIESRVIKKDRAAVDVSVLFFFSLVPPLLIDISPSLAVQQFGSVAEGLENQSLQVGGWD
jgi:hypothetical protein